MQKFISIFIVVFIFSHGFSQIKTDINKNTITLTNIVKPVFDSLPSVLEENSGFFIFNRQFYLINDSGGKNCIYVVDQNGKLTRTITVDGAENIDWEEVSLHDSTVYIGDFGNNAGNRNDLCIYKTRLPLTDNDTVICSQKHFFTYADYTPDSSGVFDKTNFDCESVLQSGDTIYLFTKRWLDYSTVVYALPADFSKTIAIPVKTISAGFLVTAVIPDISGNYLILLGYRKFKTFVMVIDNFLAGKKTNNYSWLFELSDLNNKQTEAMAIMDGLLYISTEATQSCVQTVYFIPLNAIVPE